MRFWFQRRWVWFSCIFYTVLLLPSCSQSALQLVQKEPVSLEESLRAISEEELCSIYRRLESAGFNPGHYEDRNLTQLAEALQAFQQIARNKSPNLEVTGRLDQETWEALRGLYDPERFELKATLAAPAQPTPQPPAVSQAQPVRPEVPLFNQGLPMGAIKIVQETLHYLGYDLGTPDDAMNPLTRQAIQRFQRDIGLNVTGELDKETFFALFNARCQEGCYYNVSFQADPTVPQATDRNPIVLTGTSWEAIFVKAFKKLLLELGYNPGGFTDETIDPTTQQALRQFQQEHRLAENGQLDNPTAFAIFAERCKTGCDVFIAVNLKTEVLTIPSSSRNYREWIHEDQTGNITISNPPPPSKETSGNEIVREIDPRQIRLDYAVNLQDQVFAVEKAECSEISGDWVIFYEGRVTNKDPNTVAVSLEKRFGYRYHPEKEGIDHTSWWCVPTKRHCYAQIQFSDWGGKYFPNQIARFPISQVYNAKIEIVNGMALFLRQACHR